MFKYNKAQLEETMNYYKIDNKGIVSLIKKGWEEAKSLIADSLENNTRIMIGMQESKNVVANAMMGYGFDYNIYDNRISDEYNRKMFYHNQGIDWEHEYYVEVEEDERND